MSETYILLKRFNFDAKGDNYHKVVRFTPDRNKDTVVLEYCQTKETPPYDWLRLYGIRPESHPSVEMGFQLGTGMPLTVSIPFGRAVWKTLVGEGWTVPYEYRPSCYLPLP
jgi:hypothetical protein